MANKRSKVSHTLLDFMMENLLLPNDAAVAKYLDTVAPVISKIRAKNIKFGAQYIIRLHEKTGWPVAMIKEKLMTEASNG